MVQNSSRQQPSLCLHEKAHGPGIPMFTFEEKHMVLFFWRELKDIFNPVGFVLAVFSQYSHLTLMEADEADDVRSEGSDIDVDDALPELGEARPPDHLDREQDSDSSTDDDDYHDVDGIDRRRMEWMMDDENEPEFVFHGFDVSLKVFLKLLANKVNRVVYPVNGVSIDLIL